MKRQKITSEIEYIRPSDIQSGLVCCGIVFHASPTLFIDVCLEEEDSTRLIKEVRPQIAVATHFHIDHSKMLQLAAQYSKTDIFLPRGEIQYLTCLENYAELLGPYDAQFKQTCLQFLIKSGYKQTTHYQPYDNSADLGITSADRIQVIPTPGHSPNHKSFYFTKEKLLFSGDVGLDKIGPWYAFPNSNILEHIESILRLMTLDIETVITSHSKMITGNINSRFRTGLKMILEREKMICRKMDKGYSHDQIIEDGILFEDKHLMTDPLKTIHYSGEQTALLHHLKIIQNGGIGKYFPRLNAMLQG